MCESARDGDGSLVKAELARDDGYLQDGSVAAGCRGASEDVGFRFLAGRKPISFFFQGFGNEMIGRNNSRRGFLFHAPKFTPSALSFKTPEIQVT